MARAISADVRQLRDLTRRMRQEADGKQLRKDLMAQMRKAGEPLAGAVRANVRGLPSRTPGRRRGGSLRAKIAQRVKVKATAGGKWAGVVVFVAQRIGLPRGFYNAPRVLNRGQWRHPAWGRSNSWVDQQISPAGWFDTPAKAHYKDGREAAKRALDDMARRLAGR